MSYEKGDKLRYKGHKLGDIYDSIPGIIIYKTNRPECVSCDGDFIIISEQHKPKEF